MKVALVNPPLMARWRDPLGSGIPAMPVGICYVAAALRDAGHEAVIVDGFGQAPRSRYRVGPKHVATGMTPEAIAAAVPRDAGLVGLTVHASLTAGAAREILASMRAAGVDAPMVVGGALPTTRPGSFLDAGADFVAMGEGEHTAVELAHALERGDDPRDVAGIAVTGSNGPRRERPFVADIDTLPFPAIDLLPLESYWSLGYCHGPYRGRHTFLITSRGCSLKCTFCASNALWTRRWRMRSPERVVDEMEAFHRRHGIVDFHIQDDNFAHLKGRVVEIAREILRRGLDITWLNASGTRIDSLDDDAIEVMARSGFRYVSVSPESGSERLRYLMKKPYDEGHHLGLVRAMVRHGVRSQACFVVGYPGETDRDRRDTRALVRRLAKTGVDELGVFIMTPLPGAEAEALFPDRPESDDELTYSPRFRADYPTLARERMLLHALFFATKLRRRPRSLLRHVTNLARRRFETKIEMTAYRLLTLALPRRRRAFAG